MSQNPDPRDKVIAQLAAETLRSSSAAADTSCPDMEVLAAYAERGLEPGEAAGWERHFADCGRCRKTLALLAVSTEAITREAASLRSPRTNTSVAPITMRPQPPVAQPRHSPLRWLIPAFGVAAAAALWFAIRPIPPATQTVAVLQKEAQGVVSNATNPTPYAAPAVRGANSTATNSPATNSPAANSPATDSEVAQAEPAPPSPAAAASASLIAPRRDVNELKKDQKEESAQAPSAAPSAEPNSDSFSASARARPAAPAPQAPVSAQQPPVTVLEAEKSSRAGAPPANTAPSNPSSGPLAAQSNLPLASPRVANSFAKAPDGLATFGAPGGALWRAGASGHIERSLDQGRTWQVQTSGVTADLLAGAAVSSQVAWIAGRAGIILRTTDGVTWQRIVPPTGLTLDWTSIEASDAQHATIASADLRRFTTSDGGRTWIPQ